MRQPYVIERVTLITYNGTRLPLEIINHEIITKSVKLVKEQILDAFSTMVDKPVKVVLHVRYI